MIEILDNIAVGIGIGAGWLLFLGLVLFLLFMTQFNDICQYIWGKMLGRHKIIPKFRFCTI